MDSISIFRKMKAWDSKEQIKRTILLEEQK